MKTWKSILLSLFAGLIASVSFAQSGILADAWQDPAFVERFTGSFLPLNELEPKITENESDLFAELAELLAQNQADQAISRLASYIKATTDPSAVSAALNYTLANLYLQNNRFAEAVSQYETAIKKFPNFRRAYKNLGLARIQSGEYALAIKALVKAIELGDSAGDTFGLIAYSYLNDGNPTAALEGYRQATLLNPGNKEWRIGKAEALLRTDRYEESIAAFKQLINEMPERSAFYTSIANAYLSLQDSQSASLVLEVLRRQGQARAPALGLLGDIYVNEGLPGLAYIAYADAVETGDFSTTKSIRALRAMLSRGYYPESGKFLDLIDTSLSTRFSDTETREVLNLRAQLLLANGADEEAAATLERVLEQDPLNGNALMLLGDFSQKNEDLETAIYYYQRALNLSEFQREAQLQLARIYVHQKEYLQAIRQLEGALQLQYAANVQDFLDAVRAVYNRSL